MITAAQSGPSTPGWTLRGRLGAAFVTLAVLLVSLVAIAAFALGKFVQSTDDVLHRWQPAASTADRVLDDLVNQETGVRGYALTHKARYLQPYTRYRQQERTDERRVDALIAGRPGLRRLFDAMVGTAAEWQHVTVTRVLADAAAGRTSPVGIFDDGKARFDRIRARSQAFVSAVNSEAAVAQAARRRDGVYASVVAGLSLLVLVASGVALWRGLYRWVLGPVDRLGAQTRVVASGDRTLTITGDGPAELVHLGVDIDGMRLQILSELARAEDAQDELRKQGAELARSNDDLAQFAYVASHDLSEPLRKVANFCQLIERQYGPLLDDRGRQYIFFAVDGAKRMQILITDLLAFSRVGRSTDAFVPLGLDAEVDQALANLNDKMAAAGATVERSTPLPTVMGDHTLLVSLFENLVGNAVKYRRDDVAPVVRLSAEYDAVAREWLVFVRDNGIGIDPVYGERIFAVFQRLHLRDRYGGTGIGLALCRKIVEFHGGRIRLADVQSPPGATFVLALPESGIGAESRD